MNPENIWLRQHILRKAAKMIAMDFFPKPARKDIYSTCMEVGREVLPKFDKQKHGDLWQWVFLNMLASVDAFMCALMIRGVARSRVQWQKSLAGRCLDVARKNLESSSAATKAKAIWTADTSSHPTSR